MMRGRQSGQVLVIMVVFMLALVVALYTVVNVGGLVRRKVLLQTAADAAAKSAAASKARSLNEISALNSGIVGSYALQALVLASERLSRDEKQAWYSMLGAQARAFSNLGKAIGSKAPWRAVSQAHTVAHLNITGGSEPDATPSEQHGFPRAKQGAIAFSPGWNFPPEYGFGEQMVSSPMPPKIARGILFGAAGKYLGVGKKFVQQFSSARPLTLNSNSPIQVVAWRSKETQLVGYFLDRFRQGPGMCFAQANAHCDSKIGDMSLFVPNWVAALEPSRIAEEDMAFACKTASIPFWEGKANPGDEVVLH